MGPPDLLPQVKYHFFTRAIEVISFNRGVVELPCIVVQFRIPMESNSTGSQDSVRVLARTTLKVFSVSRVNGFFAPEGRFFCFVPGYSFLKIVIQYILFLPLRIKIR